MNLIETYSYNGCRASGGPWNTVIAANISPCDVVPAAQKWCQMVKKDMLENHHNCEDDLVDWRYTIAPELLRIPSGWIADSKYPRMTVVEFYGQGESYKLILVA